MLVSEALESTAGGVRTEILLYQDGSIVTLQDEGVSPDWTASHFKMAADNSELKTEKT